MSNQSTITLQAEYNDTFHDFNQSRHRYRVAKGSAGSGKSVDIAQNLVTRLMDPKYKGANLLVVRKIESSNCQSTFKEILGAIFRICGPYAGTLWEWKQNPLTIRCKTTGNEVYFRGLKDTKEREKVKSITVSEGKLCWIWIEEATELEKDDLEILDDRLRGILPHGLFYQITLSFNPISAMHWIKSYFFDTPSPDVFTHHSTYLDNRFIDDGFLSRMERRKLLDPEGYRVYGLGEWGETEGLILTNWHSDDFDQTLAFCDSRNLGQDWGFNHANAILDVGYNDGTIYVGSEIYVYEKTTSQIIEIADSNNLPRKVPMLCDDAEPDRILDWRNAGYAAMPAKKAKYSVNRRIDWLKQRDIVVHPSCVWTMRELSQWKWKKDTKTGLYMDIEVDFFNEAIKALMYASVPWMDNKGSWFW